MPSAIMEPSVAIKCEETLPITRWSRVIKSSIIRLRKLLTPLNKGSHLSSLSSQITIVHHNASTSTAEGAYPGATRRAVDRKSPEICHIRDDDNATKVERVCLINARREIDRICPEMYYISCNNNEDAKIAVRILDDAMNLLQSDFITKSRSRLRDVSELISKLDSNNFKTPSGNDLEVIQRGEELFWTWGGQKGVYCSVKHGIILLDSSNAQFYARMVNVLGAFATETSEFQIAEKSFTILSELHGTSNLASRLSDVGAAFNNRGCILLIRGEYKRACSDFQNSLRHLNCSKSKQLCRSTIDYTIIAVKSNICCLDVSSRYFSKVVAEQERLVEECKTRDDELPFQTAFMVLLNQAAMYKTLAMFPKAEKVLASLKMLCEKMRREECESLLNFVYLLGGEVLLLRAKQKPRAFPFESTSGSVHELSPFQGLHSLERLHLNVRIESFEKWIDVLVLLGKIKLASELLEEGLKIVKNVFGLDHFNVASLLYKQGMILKLMGELPSALEKFEEAKEIWRQIFGEKHPLLINCYEALGDIALRLERVGESHLYFQRAMENVEIIHQVSLPDQLSKKYLALTRSLEDNSLWEFRRREVNEGIVEGLVAEHGLALAVLVPRLGIEHRHASRKKRNKGKQPLVEKVDRVAQSESTSIISQKCMRDLFQSGRKFLQHGMTKEAVAFFKQASRYGLMYNIACPNAALVQLCTIITQTKLTSRNELETSALSSFFEEVKADTAANGKEESNEGNSEDGEMLTFDNKMTLKLVLIFFVLLSIHLRMHDTTFAAYDFYASQFPKDDQCFLTLDGELQVYASRTSITCNGQTAIQDVFVSSAIFERKSDWGYHLYGKPLFRSLAYRSNEPSYNLLATLSSPFFLDVDDVKKLEQKVLHSFQEYFQLKCLGFESNATQAIVDLTCFCKQDVMTSDSRIELLPLCLFEQASQSKIPNEGNTISEIVPGLCERITRMNFTDKQTTCAMFSKISLWFLKNCTRENMTTLRPQHECLVLTVLDPVRARVTLWHKDISIMQKIQVIRIAERTPQLDEIGREYNFCEDLFKNSNPCCKAIEQFVKPFSSPFTTTLGVRCKVSVVRRQCASLEEPQNAHDKRREPTGRPSNDERRKAKEDSSSHGKENEAVRTDVQVSTLKLLTEISRLSLQVSENEIKPEDESVYDPTFSTRDCIAISPDEQSTSDPERGMTPVGAAERAISGNFQQTTCSREPDTLSTEAEHLSLKEEDPIAKANDDANVLGRKLFEKDRKSRRLFITEFQEGLRKKEMQHKINSESHDWSANKESEDEVSSFVEAPLDDVNRSIFGKNNFAVSGGEERKDREEKDKKNEEYSTACCEVSERLESAAPLQTEQGKEEENSATSPISSKPLTHLVNQKRTQEIQTIINKTATGITLPNPGDVNAIVSEPFGVSKSDCATGFYDCDHEESCQPQMGAREIYQDENPERSPVQRNVMLQKKDSSQTKDKDMAQSKGRVDRNGTAGCFVSNSAPQASKDVANGTNNFNENTQATEEMETSVGHLLQREDFAGDNYSTRPLLQKTEQVFGGPTLSNKEDNNKSQTQNSFSSTFLEGDAIADGFTPEASSLRSGYDVVSPALMAESPSRANTIKEETILEGGKTKKNEISLVGLKSFDEPKCIHNHRPINFESSDVSDGPVEICTNDTNMSYSSPDFGGVRPKQGFFVEEKNSSASAKCVNLRSAHQPEKIIFGLDPDFVERHAVADSSLTSKIHNANLNGATWDDPREDNIQEHYFSERAFGNVNSVSRLTGEGPLQICDKSNSNCRRLFTKEAFAGSGTIKSSVPPQTLSQVTLSKQDESWHFPPPPGNVEKCVKLGNFPATDRCDNTKHDTQETLMQECELVFDDPTSRNSHKEVRSLANKFIVEQGSHGEAPTYSTSYIEEEFVGGRERPQGSSEGYQESLLEFLGTAMSRTVNLFALINAAEEQVTQSKSKEQHTEKLSIQEEAVSEHNEHTETAGEVYFREQVAPLPRDEQTADTGKEERTSPVQERPRPACGHYQRRCLVSFPCCGRFYPCHRCHNESAACSHDQARAINATHIRCTICYHEQVIDEGSQKCRGCNSKMSDYFCAICKHFTSLDKNPFHCDKCGICRIHRDKSFHCNVCNVCLDKRLQGKHKCRPDSGHDECCICLEDAFSGCQILPCSHKVHKDCAIAMIQNGVRTCPICRHPLFQQPEGSEQ